MVDCQVLNYRKAMFSGISFSFSGNIPAHLRWVTNELPSFVTRVPTPTTLDRWDMVTARVCYVSLMVILHITVQVTRDGAYDVPSSSEKTINFN